MLVKILWLRKQPSPGSLSIPCCPSVFDDDLERALCSSPALPSTLHKALQEPFTKQMGLSRAGFLKKSSGIPLDCSLGWAPPLPGKQVQGHVELQHSPALDSPCGAPWEGPLGLWKQHTWVLYPKSSLCWAAAPQLLLSNPAPAQQGQQLVESAKEGISCLSPWEQKELNCTGISLTWTQQTHAKCSALRTILPKQVGVEVWSVP